MARVFLTIKGLCELVYKESVDARIPKPFFDIEERVKASFPEWEKILLDSQKANELSKL